MNRLADLSKKTVKIISGSSILIRQYYALIDNFDVRFVEILFIFSDCSENILREFEIRNCFRRVHRAR